MYSLQYNHSESLLIPHSNSIKPSLTESFRALFYLILPSESKFKDISQVPDYTAAASPAFFVLIGLEFIIATLKGKQGLRANDAITSISAGVNSRLIRLLTKVALEMTLYIYVYENWRLTDLPWDSSVTWCLSFVAMDFAYYWFHRAAHGPLEYILNTPSHHRVHHGRNPYCIDKNYAGALIIWDRMFGTFAAERKNEKVVYGLVSPLNSFNPFYVQVVYIKATIERVWNIEGFGNKLSVLFKGPGWSPGKPRLGEYTDIPKVEQPVIRYGGTPRKRLATYAVLHYIALMPLYDKLMFLRLKLAADLIVFDVAFILFGLTCLGFLFDGKSYAYHVETVRCLVSAILLQLGQTSLSTAHELPASVLLATQLFYLFSALMWIFVLHLSGGKKKNL